MSVTLFGGGSADRGLCVRGILLGGILGCSALAPITVAGPRMAVSDAPAAAIESAAPDARILQLRTGDVDTRSLPNLLESDEAISAEEWLVLQLDGAMTPARQAALEAAGVSVSDYLPQNAFLVRLFGNSASGLAGLPFVRWLGRFESLWKIDPEIGVRPVFSDRRQNLIQTGRHQVVVCVFPSESPDEALAELSRSSVEVIGAYAVGQQWMIDAIASLGDVEALAGLPSVQFIEAAPDGSMRNDTNRWIVQSNSSGQTPVWTRGIRGEGQIGGLIDGTIRETHCMFDDSVAIGPSHRKIVAQRNATSYDSHGTHTAGTLAGDASSFGAYTTNDGVAYAARISATEVGPVYSSPSTLNARLTDAHNDGARVHSNSWGDDGTTAYTTWCRQIDQFTWDNEDNVVAFAVTNQSSLKTPENSTNVLAVGASQDSPSQSSHCSGGVGPTADGRRKPEIYAPGCSTVSAASSSSCGTTSATGTSMACPAVSGAGLLVRQYFTAGYYPTGAAQAADARTPTGALIRAVLLNATVDMSGITGYPSNLEGWGRLLLDNALFFPGDARKLYIEDVRRAAGLSTGQTRVYTFSVTSGSQPLRITLAYTQPPAAVNASNPVVNNLDLEVMAPASTLYLGNVFSSGQSSTGGTADIRNGVEQVLRTSPATGEYTVTIRGSSVNTGPQGFALVVTGDIATGSCAAPSVTVPPAPQSVCEGSPITLSVTANGSTPLGYQWRLNTVNIGGATAASLLIPAATPADAGSYDCVVSNACGSSTSPAALLEVTGSPTGDVDGDCDVDLSDLSALLASFGTCQGDGGFNPEADLDLSGCVDLSDLSVLLANFGV